MIPEFITRDVVLFAAGLLCGSAGLVLATVLGIYIYIQWPIRKGHWRK